MPDGAAGIGLQLLYRFGWRIGPRTPVSVQRLIARRGAEIAVRRGGRHLDQFAENLRIATGSEPSPALLRAGMESYLRNMIEIFALPGWSRSQIIGRVSTSGEDDLRRAHRDTGAVVALPHSGNWDLAGAWACLTGMPVTTVAEQLEGPEFEAFLRFRCGLGMDVISHRDPQTLPKLIKAVRSGRVVCLVADRDLIGTGIAVSWNGHPVTMPGGPALVARRTGCALFPMVPWFTEHGLHLEIGAPIEHRTGRDGMRQMVQDTADFFAARIKEHPQDWHLMQPFFAGAVGGV